MSTRVLPNDDSDDSVEGRLQRPEPGVRETEHKQGLLGSGRRNEEGRVIS